MSMFRKVLREINFLLANITVFEELLNAVIIFLACYLALMLIKFYPILAVVPALIYLIISSIIRVKNVKKNKASIIEEGYTPLKEKLRTAIDNIGLNNPVVESLQRDILEDIKHARISLFINGKSTSYRIFISIILCFIILFVSANDFGIEMKDLIDKGKDIIIDAKYILGGDDLGEELGEIMAATGGTELDDIYGQESAANLGNEVIDVEIKPISYEINIRNVKDVEEKEFEDTILDETCADADACSPQESYRNNYPKDQQELVKNYFLKISK
ncbi:hypothetical protein ACFLZ6_00240 [Nanoarchaeota archaeon]